MLQDVLAEGGNGAGVRSSKRFSFAVFGTPAETGAWGFRLEGHHLTQSFAVRDGRIVSVTPSSFSAYPARITSGKHAGLFTLKDEETLARRLAADVAAKPACAQVGPAALQHRVLCGARARERAEDRASRLRTSPAVSASCCGSSSRLIRCSISCQNLPRRRKHACAPGDPEAVHFAWYGPNTPEKAFGYRIIGDGVRDRAWIGRRRPRSTCTRSITTSATCSAARPDPSLRDLFVAAPQHRECTYPMRNRGVAVGTDALERRIRWQQAGISAGNARSSRTFIPTRTGSRDAAARCDGIEDARAVRGAQLPLPVARRSAHVVGVRDGDALFSAGTCWSRPDPCSG